MPTYDTCLKQYILFIQPCFVTIFKIDDSGIIILHYIQVNKGPAARSGMHWATYTITDSYVYQFSRAVITKYCKLGVFKGRTLFSQSSGGQKSETKVLAGLVSAEGCKGRVCAWFLSLAYRRLSSCSHDILLIYAYMEISPFYENISHQFRSTLMALTKVDYLYRDITSK